MNFKIIQKLLQKLFFVFLVSTEILFSIAAQAEENSPVEVDLIEVDPVEIDKGQLISEDKKLFIKAVEFSSQDQWSQAESIYRDLLKRNSHWPEPKNNLAILLLKTNRLDEARQMLEQAVSSSPSYRIAQKNRSQLYNYLATQAYDKALGSEQQQMMPEMQLIQEVYLPVKIIEKKVEVIVEKPVIVENTKKELDYNQEIITESKEQTLPAQIVKKILACK